MINLGLNMFLLFTTVVKKLCISYLKVLFSILKALHHLVMPGKNTTDVKLLDIF